MVCAGIVSEYDFDLRAVGKRLRDHHESLCISSKDFFRGSRSGFIQCLQERGGSIYITPATCFIIESPLRIDIFQTDALYGTSCMSSPHEPDGCQGMVESKSHGCVGVAGQFSRLCHEKIIRSVTSLGIVTLMVGEPGCVLPESTYCPLSFGA